MDPDAQMQLTIRNPGTAGALYLDVWPSGRGFRVSVQHPEAVEAPAAALFAGGEFDLVRSRAGGTPHRSAKLLGGETLTEAFMAHLLESDQIRAVLKLDIRYEGDELMHACGFLVQVTPEGERADVERLLANLESAPALADMMTDSDPDARAFGTQLLDGYRWDQSAREEVAFVCRCSRDRLVAILSGLPFDKERIEGAFATEFMNRGMDFKQSGGDITVSLFIVMDQKTGATAYTTHMGYGGYGYPGWGWGMGASSTTYNEYDYYVGTLVCDVFDTESKKLVWQGVVSGEIDDNPNSRERNIPRVVQEIMKKYPVKPIMK